eukprot:119711_1
MAMIGQNNDTNISNVTTQRILAAIHSLENPTKTSMDKWFKSNLCSMDDIHPGDVETTLRHLVNTGIVNTVKRRYTLSNSIAYQPEPENSHIHSNNFKFSINYGELQIKKGRSQQKMIATLKSADRYASLITSVFICVELKDSAITQILQFLASLEMRKYIKKIDITTDLVGNFDSAFLQLDPTNFTNLDAKNYVFPKLQSVIISPSDCATKNLMKVIAGFASPNLRSIFISICESRDGAGSWTGVVTKIVEKANLKNIHFNYGYFHHSALNQLDFVNLERLDLPNSDILKLTPQFLNTFVQCKKLKVLNMDTGLTDVETEKRKQCETIIKLLKNKHPNTKINIRSLH